MRFELNEYHHNVKSEEFINDIKNVAIQLNKNTITQDEYKKNGKYHPSTVTKRLGSWFAVLEMADLLPSRSKMGLSDNELIDDLIRVYSLIAPKPMTGLYYSQMGKHGLNTIIRRLGGWDSALAKANIPVRWSNKKIPDDALFEEIERVWVNNGKQPTYMQMREQSKYSVGVYEKRFGGWRNALEEFIKYINSDDNADTISATVPELALDCNTSINNRHKTNRNVNDRLRFKVFQRDSFKCCACGTSPAKNPAVELHVDHKIPWSKGGETTIDNLQTLCSKCNYGKSDVVY